mgnify:FL=1
MRYNIFILQVPPMHRSERNLDVRVGIMPTIHPIYRRNNLENNFQNNGINFSNQPVVFENKPTIAITKAKARATAKATAKAITKENLSSCQADKPPRERSFLFLDRMILVKRRASVQEAFALPWGTPPQLRIRSAAPPEVEPRALRAGLHHSSNHTVDVQTPPASLHSATSPSRGGKGAARRACTLIWVLAEIRGYGRMLSAPTVRVGKLVPFNRDTPRITASILSRTIIG